MPPSYVSQLTSQVIPTTPGGFTSGLPKSLFPTPDIPLPLESCELTPSPHVHTSTRPHVHMPRLTEEPFNFGIFDFTLSIPVYRREYTCVDLWSMSRGGPHVHTIILWALRACIDGWKTGASRAGLRAPGISITNSRAIA
jgi:hypothetical protein